MAVTKCIDMSNPVISTQWNAYYILSSVTSIHTYANNLVKNDCMIGIPLIFSVVPRGSQKNCKQTQHN